MHTYILIYICMYENGGVAQGACMRVKLGDFGLATGGGTPPPSPLSPPLIRPRD